MTDTAAPKKKSLRGATKSLIKKADVNWARPVRVGIKVYFQHENRKVTPADLERAAEAAAAAFRASLEGRTPAYAIGSVQTEVEYAYVMSSATITS